jgi:hypothetical protein
MIDLDSLATEQTDVKALACNALSEVCRLSDHVMGALSAMRLMHIALDPGAAKVPIVKVEIRSTNVVVGPRSASPNPVVCLSNWFPTSVRAAAEVAPDNNIFLSGKSQWRNRKGRSVRFAALTRRCGLIILRTHEPEPPPAHFPGPSPTQSKSADHTPDSHFCRPSHSLLGSLLIQPWIQRNPILNTSTVNALELRRCLSVGVFLSWPVRRVEAQKQGKLCVTTLSKRV